MSILYACTKCRERLDNIQGIEATNEVGRKSCYGCGDNKDNLETFDEIELTKKVKVYNRKILNKD